jgi:high-affinity nickel-transport protein
MNEGKRPMTVGLFFSLGHSTVVVCLTIGVIFSSQFISSHLEDSKEVGSIIGTSVSAFFLLLIGAINLRVLYQTYQDWKLISTGKQRFKQSVNLSVVEEGHQVHAENHEQKEEVEVNGPQGFAAVCCPALFHVIDAPWKMYPLGFLFGLGFDTASEVALLGIAAITSHQEIPAIAVLLLPLLFTAGMSLIDTIDGIFMLWAYGWAFVNPAKKIFYNMFLTGTSACVAFLVGGVEVGGILVDKLHLTGTFWHDWKALSENFETLGFVIIGIFTVSFLISVVMFKYLNLKDVQASTITERTPLMSSAIIDQGEEVSFQVRPVPSDVPPTFKTLIKQTPQALLNYETPITGSTTASVA